MEPKLETKLQPKLAKKHDNDSPKTLDNRSFGLIFGGIFMVIAVWPLIFSGDFRSWAGVIAAAFGVIALALSTALGPLNRAWAAFGQIMHKITNPLLMGLVFFITVVPTALVLKLLGKDPLRRKLDKNSESYWITRDSHTINKESFDNQF